MVNLEADRFVHLLGKCLRFFAVPQSAFIVGCHTHGTWPATRGAGVGAVQVVESAKQPEIDRTATCSSISSLSVCQSVSLLVLPVFRCSASILLALSLATSTERVLNLRRFIARLPFHYFSPFRRRCVAVYFCKFLSYFWFLLLYFCIFFPFTALSLPSSVHSVRVMSCACKVASVRYKTKIKTKQLEKKKS